MKTREEIEARINEYLRQRHAILIGESFRAGPLLCEPRKWNRSQKERQIEHLNSLTNELRWVLSLA